MRVTTSEIETKLDTLIALVERLQLDTGDLRSDLRSVQERLSALESRTPGASASPAREVSSAARSSQASSAPVAGYHVGPEREAAARDIGRWLAKSVDGVARGLSGRERIPQQTRYYLAVRDFHRNLYDPPLFLSNWPDCKERVQCRGQVGDSIFIGLPTKRKCYLAVLAAGLVLPAELIGLDGQP